MATGAGRYTSDWNFPVQVYAVFTWADPSHANLRAIDASGAREVGGVFAVRPGEDTRTAVVRAVPSSTHYAGVGGAAVAQSHSEGMAETRVRYGGPQVVLLVPYAEAIAQDAIQNIGNDYEVMASGVDAVDALKRDALQLKGCSQSNSVFGYENGNKASAQEAFV